MMVRNNSYLTCQGSLLWVQVPPRKKFQLQFFLRFLELIGQHWWWAIYFIFKFDISISCYTKSLKIFEDIFIAHLQQHHTALLCFIERGALECVLLRSVSYTYRDIEWRYDLKNNSNINFFSGELVKKVLHLFLPKLFFYFAFVWVYILLPTCELCLVPDYCRGP